METGKAPTEKTIRRRVRLWSREIVVAVVLTLAALLFLSVARMGGSGSSDETSSQGPAPSISRK